MEMLYIYIEFINELEKENHNQNKPKYKYKTYFADLKAGDLVVVETKFGYAVGKVVEYTDKPKKSKAFVVSKIDIEDFLSNKQKLEDIKATEAEIHKRVAEIQDNIMIREFSKIDGTLNKLVDKLEGLKS